MDLSAAFLKTSFGITNGAISSYLYHRTENNLEAKIHPIDSIALEVNHLSMLCHTLLREAKIHAPAFSFFSRKFFFITPLLLLANSVVNWGKKGEAPTFFQKALSVLNGEKKDVSPLKDYADMINGIYYIAAIVTSIFLVALGNIIFGFSFFCMVAGDFFINKEINLLFGGGKIFFIATKILSVSSFLGYGVWVVLTASLVEKIVFGIIGGQLFLPSIWKFLKGETSSQKTFLEEASQFIFGEEEKKEISSPKKVKKKVFSSPSVLQKDDLYKSNIFKRTCYYLFPVWTSGR